MKITLKAAIAISLIHALWGGNPVAVKFGLEVFPPLWSGFLRFTIAIVCILIWAWIKGIPMMLKREELVPFSMLGLLFFIQIWLMNEGFSLSSGTISSVLISTFPLFAAFFSHYMIKGDQLTYVRTTGLLVAFVGTSLIVFRGGGLSADEFSTWGAWIVLLSAMLLGLRLIMSARMVRQTEPTRVVVWMMILSLWAFFLGGLMLEEINWQNLSWEPLAGILYQGVVIAGFGFMAYGMLYRYYSPILVSSFGFISPVCGVFLSSWMLDEPITWIITVGTSCVGAGLVLIVRPNLKSVKLGG